MYKQITLGGKPVKNFAGWTALANTLLVEDVIGVYKDHDGWIVEPHIPQEWIGSGKNILLTLPFFQAEFKMNASDEDGITIEHVIHGKKGALTVKNHERVNLGVS
nr:hypothetical protein [Candidatus Sigynarchaeota archaeon]